MKDKYTEKLDTEQIPAEKKAEPFDADARPSAKTIRFIKEFAHSYYVESSMPEKCREFVLN